MVNEEKVCKMTKLALDESKYMKEDIRQGAYYRSDYVRIHTMKVLLSYSLSYLLLLGLICQYHLEYLFVNVVKLDFREVAYVAGGIYIGILFVVMLLCIIYYTAKYTNTRKNLRTYLARLRELEHLQQQGKERGNT